MLQGDLALHVASISPLYGIGAGSWTAFFFSALMAAVFFALLMLKERQVWETLAIREIVKADEFDSESENPFL